MVGFSPDSRIAWAQEDTYGGNVAFWHTSDGRRLWSAVLPQGWKHGWNYNRDGRYVVVTTSPDVLDFRDTETGRIVRQIHGSLGVVLSPDGRWVYTVDATGRVHKTRAP